MKGNQIIGADGEPAGTTTPTPKVHIQPRNTFVTVRVYTPMERTEGSIAVPASKDDYREGEVIAVGPGIIAAGGGDSGTQDLEPGMRVLVKTHTRRPGPNGGQLVSEGLPLGRFDNDEDVPDTEMFMFAEQNILAILTTPDSND